MNCQDGPTVRKTEDGHLVIEWNCPTCRPQWVKVTPELIEMFVLEHNWLVDELASVRGSRSKLKEWYDRGKRAWP